MPRKIKYDREKIVEFLREHGPKTPTQIGMQLFGIDREKASGTMCPMLFDLRRANKIDRISARLWVALPVRF